MDLHGKTALVTGGARRLGRAIAIELARGGADVIIHTSSAPEAAAQTLADLRALGVRAAVVQGDLADVAAAERIVDHAVAIHGRLDVLVNNSGIWGATPVGAVTAARWDELMHVNLRAAFFVAQRAAPQLTAARGAVLNIADVGVQRPWADHTPYLVSKGGVVTLTHALARDLAPAVRVNAIAPGPVLKPDDWSDEQAASGAKGTLLKRWGTAEDVGRAARFLIEADYITGVVLPVDGGWLLA